MASCKNVLYWLSGAGEPCFPNPDLCSREGVVAVGGSLGADWLLAAYARGIFPWYDASSPLLWWCPDPRFVLYPRSLHIPRSLRRQLNRPEWKVSVDKAFPEVMHGCASAGRPGQSGTWIHPEMESAYGRLHEMGYVHSLEVWRGGKLAGGLYGVAVGQAFFGESMFFSIPDASKVGVVWLARLLDAWGYGLIDCQQQTRHLERFGAIALPRGDFLAQLRHRVSLAPHADAWDIPSGFHPLDVHSGD